MHARGARGERASARTPSSAGRLIEPGPPPIKINRRIRPIRRTTAARAPSPLMRAGSLTFRPPPVRLAAKAKARPGCMAPASGANSPSSPCVASAMHPHLSTILYSQEVLATRTRELGAQLSKEYATSRPLVLQVRACWAANPKTCCLRGHVAPRRALQRPRCAASRLRRRVATPPRGGARAAARMGLWRAGPGPQPPRVRFFSLARPSRVNPRAPCPTPARAEPPPLCTTGGLGAAALCSHPRGAAARPLPPLVTHTALPCAHSASLLPPRR